MKTVLAMTVLGFFKNLYLFYITFGFILKIFRLVVESRIVESFMQKNTIRMFFRIVVFCVNCWFTDLGLFNCDTYETK